jgi:hypothetical protein
MNVTPWGLVNRYKRLCETRRVWSENRREITNLFLPNFLISKNKRRFMRSDSCLLFVSYQRKVADFFFLELPVETLYSARSSRQTKSLSPVNSGNWGHITFSLRPSRKKADQVWRILKRNIFWDMTPCSFGDSFFSFLVWVETESTWYVGRRW